MHFPDPKKAYYLETDASHYALGAILYQKNDQQEKEIITLASRTLKGPELSYFTTEKELLAIVWALQKFRTYLQGAQIINRTNQRTNRIIQALDKENNNQNHRTIMQEGILYQKVQKENTSTYPPRY